MSVNLKGLFMYTDSAAVAAVPAGVTGAALFAPGQVGLGLVLVAAMTLILGVLLTMRTRRLGRVDSE